MRLLRITSALALGLGLGVVASDAWGQTATSTALTVTSGGAPVTTVKQGTLVALTATVTVGNAAALPPGQVEFCEVKAAPLECTDIRLLGTVQLSSAGNATFNFIPGLVGTHIYQAVFLGTHVEAASASTNSSLSVTPYYPTATTLAATGGPGDYTLTATVTSTGGTTAPTGTIDFLDTTNANYVLAATTQLVPAPENYGLSFGSATSLTQSDQINFVAKADFNGDGKLDMVSPENSDQAPIVTVLLGNGDGTFTLMPRLPDTNQASNYIAVGDFNGDGKPDMAVDIENSQFSSVSVQILLGNGDGTFSTGQLLTNCGGGWVAAGDLNGDGIEDLVVENITQTGSGASQTTTASASVFLGNGDGTFRPGAAVPFSLTNPQVNDGFIGFTVGDFNRDGKLDLAVVNTVANTVVVLLGNGDGTFTASPQSPATRVNPSSIVTADLNGDGILDLAVGDASSISPAQPNVTILLGKGDGTFLPTVGIQSTGTGVAQGGGIAVGDVNGDGIADLAVSSRTLWVEQGNGDGTFTQVFTVAAVAAGPSEASPVMGDANADGLDDIATVGQLATVGNEAVTELLSGVGPQSATATVTGISPVGTGGHDVDASYSGNSVFRPSVSPTVPLTALQVATGLTVTASPNPSSYGQQVTLTATLAPAAAQDHNATGTVTFSNGSTVLGTGTLANGVVAINTTALPVDVIYVTAYYSGDQNFESASAANLNVVVNGYASAAALTVAPNPVSAGQTVTLTAAVTGTGYSSPPTGAVTFLDGGTTVLGGGTLDGTGHASLAVATLGIGSHNITAAYAGNAAYYASTSAAVRLTVNALADTTTLTVGPNPAGVGQTVTMTAAVAGSASAGTLSGTVTFYDGATALGSGTLDASGHATFATAGLALGTHSLTAVYGGNSIFGTSSSLVVSEVIQTVGFTISLSSPSVTLETHQHTTTSVSLTSLGSFADSMAVSCGDLPMYVTCIFTPNPAALAGNGTTVVSFYLDTDSILGGGGRSGPMLRSRNASTSGAGLALVLSPLGLIAVLRRRRLSLLGMVFVVVCAALMAGGCGNTIIAVPSAAPGTYTIPITATGSVSGLTHTAQLTLTVTP